MFQAVGLPSWALTLNPPKSKLFQRASVPETGDKEAKAEEGPASRLMLVNVGLGG